MLRANLPPFLFDTVRLRLVCIALRGSQRPQDLSPSESSDNEEKLIKKENTLRCSIMSCKKLAAELTFIPLFLQTVFVTLPRKLYPLYYYILILYKVLKYKLSRNISQETKRTLRYCLLHMYLIIQIAETQDMLAEFES